MPILATKVRQLLPKYNCIIRKSNATCNYQKIKGLKSVKRFFTNLATNNIAITTIE